MKTSQQQTTEHQALTYTEKDFKLLSSPKSTVLNYQKVSTMAYNMFDMETALANMSQKQQTNTMTDKKHEILRGQSNYIRWKRELMVQADTEGLLSLFCAPVGVKNAQPESILSDPGDLPPRVSLSRESRGLLDPKDLPKKEEELDRNHKDSVEIYKFRLKRYERQQERIRSAKKLLADWVDSSIHAQIAGKLPKEAWSHLEAQFKMQDSMAQSLFYAKLKDIHISRFASAQGYINALNNVYLDLATVNSNVEEGQKKAQLLQGLSDQYTRLIEQIHFDEGMGTNYTYEQLTMRILTLEAIAAQRKKDHPSTSSSNRPKDQQAGNAYKKQSPSSNTPCKVCKKKHPGGEDSCWFKHPELNPYKNGPKKVKTGMFVDATDIGDVHSMPTPVDTGTAMARPSKPKKISALASVDLNPFKKYFRATKAAMKSRNKRDKVDDSEQDDSDSMCPHTFPGNVHSDPFQTPSLPMDSDYECEGPWLEGKDKEDFVLPERGEKHAMTSNGTTRPCKEISAARGRVRMRRMNTKFLYRPRQPLSCFPHTQQIFTHACLATSSSTIQRDTWLADTGANAHIVNDRKWFQDFIPLDWTIGTANDASSMHIRGGGTVNVVFKTSQGDDCEFSLSEVAYAPDARCNLLSVSSLCEKGSLHAELTSASIKFLTQDGFEVAHAPAEDGLYRMDCENPELGPCHERNQIAALVDFDDPVWKWHRRLGHLGIQSMRRLLKQSEGMDLTDDELKAKAQAICPICATTRAINKIPRDPARRRYESVGEMLHVDTWGRYPVEGWDGSYYFLFVTDDFSRHTWSKGFFSKDQIPGLLWDIVQEIETTHDCVVRRLRCDNEFVQESVTGVCRERGISMEPIVPYAHHQNGTAERTNRTVRDKASAMIQEASVSQRLTMIITERGQELMRNTEIPENLWPEAMRHAVWLKNRSPTKAHKFEKTPFEALNRLKPDLTKERVWGSRAYVRKPPDAIWAGKSKKLHTARGWLGYFVGTESESCYRIWDPELKCVKRIAIVRIDDGEGLDDPHDEASLNNRMPPPTPPPEGFEDGGYESDLPEDDSEDDEADADDISISSRLTMHEEADFATGFEDLGIDAEDRNNIGTENRSQLIEFTQEEPEDSSGNPNSDSEGTSTSEDTKTPITSRFFDQFRYNGTNVADRVKSYRGNYKEPEKDDDIVTAEQKTKLPNESSQPGSFGKRLKRRPEDFDTRRVKKFRPDSSKCDACFKQGIACDGGRPCAGCRQRGMASCKDQTELTKALYADPNLVDKAKSIDDGKESEWKKWNITSRTPEQKMNACDPCRKHRRVCDFTNPCSQCINRGLQCSYETNARSREMQEKKSKQIPFDQRCGTCQSRIRHGEAFCDGKSPCNICVKLGKTCLPRDYMDTPACNACTNVSTKNGKLAGTTHVPSCDRGRPCSRCVKMGIRCLVPGNTDILLYGYATAEKDKTDLTEDAEECRRCEQTNRNCDRNGPCLQCLKHEPGRSRYCIYDKIGNYSEQYDLTKFTLIQTPDGPAAAARTDISDNDMELEARSGKKGTPRGFFKKDTTAILLSEKVVEKLALNTTVSARKPGGRQLTYGIAMKGEKRKRWQAAVQAEYDSLMKSGTWEVVDLPPGRKALTVTWVLKEKYGPDGKLDRYKARLCARGFQQRHGVDYEEIFAAVVKPATYKIMFALAAIYGWQILQFDVTTAFLNGDLDEEIYVQPPEGYPEAMHKVLLLKKSLYGLKQSPRAWYRKFRQEMEKLGFRVSKYDPCLFIHSEHRMYLTVYVDDIIVFAAPGGHVKAFRSQLQNTFDVTEKVGCDYYLGMHIEHNNRSIRIHQANFIQQLLDRYNLNDIVPVSTPMDPKKVLQKETKLQASDEFKSRYLSMFGSLIYLTTISRSDIAYAVSVVGRFSANPNQQHMDAVVRIYSYLKGTKTRGMNFSSSGGYLKGFVDSDWGGCPDTSRSTTGWVFTLAGSPISWSSQRQKTAALSTCEAEYMAATEATKEAVWLKGLINELNLPNLAVVSVPLMIDNNAALKLTKNAEFHGRTKHINIRYHFIREHVEKGNIDPQRIDTKDNVADILTKPLPRPAFENALRTMGMTDNSKSKAAGTNTPSVSTRIHHAHLAYQDKGVSKSQEKSELDKEHGLETNTRRKLQDQFQQSKNTREVHKADRQRQKARLQDATAEAVEKHKETAQPDDALWQHKPSGVEGTDIKFFEPPKDVDASDKQEKATSTRTAMLVDLTGAEILSAVFRGARTKKTPAQNFKICTFPNCQQSHDLTELAANKRSDTSYAGTQLVPTWQPSSSYIHTHTNKILMMTAPMYAFTFHTKVAPNGTFNVTMNCKTTDNPANPANLANPAEEPSSPNQDSTPSSRTVSPGPSNKASSSKKQLKFQTPSKSSNYHKSPTYYTPKTRGRKTKENKGKDKAMWKGFVQAEVDSLKKKNQGWSLAEGKGKGKEII